MRGNIWGWLALGIIATISVATSRPQRNLPPQPPLRFLQAQHIEEASIEQGRPLLRRFTVLLPAQANPTVDGGLARLATLRIDEHRPCVTETDAGMSCSFDAGLADGGPLLVFGGPVKISFADGGSEAPLFEGCPTEVDCMESVLLEARLTDGDPRTVRFGLRLSATVENAGLQPLEEPSGGLSIIPE